MPLSLLRAPFAAFLLCLAACSPTFNWREVPVGDDGLVALLPCKADRATRQLPFGAEAVAVDMAGCQAGQATFAVAHASAVSLAQADAWMHAWRASTRTQLDGQPIVEAATSLPRAVDSPAPVRLDAQGAKTGGTSTHVLWFVQQHAGKVSLYQATVLGEPGSPDALATFFEGLHLPP